MTEETKTSRRAVLGAAWSLPVIALAIATPAAAASAEPACEGKTWQFLPTGPNDIASITVLTGEGVLVVFVKDYPNATAININGQIYWKSPDSGVRYGESHLIDLVPSGICDPSFIQVDGNNTHYYGGGVFR